MVNGPGFYNDIGKQAKDLLFKDFDRFHKLSISTYTSDGLLFNTSGSKIGEYYSSFVSTQIKNKNITTDVKANANYKILETSVTVDDLAPGLKTILRYDFPDKQSGLFEIKYQQKHAAIDTSVQWNSYPMIYFSGVLGNDTVALGTDISYCSDTKKYKKYNFGLSVTLADLVFAMTLNDKLDNLTASYYHKVIPYANTAIGAEMNHSLSSKENTLTIGVQHALDPLTMLKAKVDSHGGVGALVQHQWHPKCLFSMSGEVDTKGPDKSGKIGVGLAINTKPTASSSV